jgi:hypothetical protein
LGEEVTLAAVWTPATGRRRRGHNPLSSSAVRLSNKVDYLPRFVGTPVGPLELDAPLHLGIIPSQGLGWTEGGAGGAGPFAVLQPGAGLPLGSPQGSCSLNGYKARPAFARAFFDDLAAAGSTCSHGRPQSQTAILPASKIRGRCVGEEGDPASAGPATTFPGPPARVPPCPPWCRRYPFVHRCKPDPPPPNFLGGNGTGNHTRRCAKNCVRQHAATVRARFLAVRVGGQVYTRAETAPESAEAAQFFLDRRGLLGWNGRC